MRGNFIQLAEGYTDDSLKAMLNDELPIITNNNKYQNNIRDMFNFALENNRKLITSQNVDKNETNEKKLKELIINWCKSYVDEKNTPASKKSLKIVGERDEALINRVNAARPNDDQATKDNYFLGHQLYMSAENFNGKMLEEFLASILEKDDYGWIWCAGTTLLSIDFIKISDGNCTLLQIKNKYNTENSSSNKIRVGTKIKKWNRLRAPSKAKGNDPYKPRPNWDKLIKIINDSDENLNMDKKKYLRNNLTEENYLKYISNNSVSSD